jgi:D-glycero-D-manno-heptose 1,7-bisphosphate phosphatase
MNVIFLDRDDTLNEDPGYLNDPVKVKLLPGVVEGLLKLHNAGYHFIVLTNQSGVGRGLITLEQLEAVHRRLLTKLEAQGVPILDLFFCPHIPDDHCNCRKPLPGLLWKALQGYPHIDLEKSWIIGDRYRDLMPGLRPHADDSGPVVKGILVGGKEADGKEGGDREAGGKDQAPPPANLRYTVADLQEAADRILGSNS